MTVQIHLSDNLSLYFHKPFKMFLEHKQKVKKNFIIFSDIHINVTNQILNFVLKAVKE